MNVHVFLQSEVLNEIAVVAIQSHATLGQLQTACMEMLPRETDATTFRMFMEDDDEAGIDPQRLVSEGMRVHLHRLATIDVHVRYAGRDVHRAFRPSATIRRIKRWAVRELGVSQSDAKELMLQVHGTDVRPDDDIHVGALVSLPHTEVTFDLVPSPRING